MAGSEGRVAKPWVPWVLLAPGLDVKSIRDLIEFVRQKPGQINFGSAEVTAMSIHPVSSRLVQASLNWALRDGSGAPLYEFDALYKGSLHPMLEHSQATQNFDEAIAALIASAAKSDWDEDS